MVVVSKLGNNSGDGGSWDGGVVSNASTFKEALTVEKGLLFTPFEDWDYYEKNTIFLMEDAGDRIMYYNVVTDLAGGGHSFFVDGGGIASFYSSSAYIASPLIANTLVASNPADSFDNNPLQGTVGNGSMHKPGGTFLKNYNGQGSSDETQFVQAALFPVGNGRFNKYMGQGFELIMRGYINDATDPNGIAVDFEAFGGSPMVWEGSETGAFEVRAKIWRRNVANSQEGLMVTMLNGVSFTARQTWSGNWTSSANLRVMLKGASGALIITAIDLVYNP